MNKLVVLFLGENPSFKHGESAVHREEPGVYRRPAPVHQLTGQSPNTDSRQWSQPASIYPSSQTPYRHNPPFSNGGVSQPTNIPLRHFSPDMVSAHLQ